MNTSIFERMNNIVLRKEAEFHSKGAVYAGSIVNGMWVPESLYDIRGDWGEIVTFPKDQEDFTPDAVLENGYEFIGGTSRRGFYMNMSKFEEFPELKEWFDEVADAHFLASMFLRPGKTARVDFPIELPAERVVTGKDGLLAAFAPAQWEEIRRAYKLPECHGAQVTVFSPETSMMGKGMIRVVEPGESPHVNLESWKWFTGEWGFRTRNMSVLTVDSVYNPPASVNKQEMSMAKSRGSRVSEWVIDRIRETALDIAAQQRTSANTVGGYFSHLGLPTPDSLMNDVRDAANNQIMKLARRWPLPAEDGWRGKATASDIVSDGEVLLPRKLERFVSVGDTVYVNRNPNLPSSGYVRFKTAGFTESNMTVFNSTDHLWSAVLGGDFDGDDAVVLFKAPFTNLPDKYLMADGTPFNLQEMKFEARGMPSATPAQRLERWKKEGEAPIGQYDLLARYSIDIGFGGQQLNDDISKVIQLAISLKKRMGDINSAITSVIRDAETETKEAKRATETWYFREYPRMSHDERALLRGTLSEDGLAIIEAIEHGVEANQRIKPRFKMSDVDDALEQLLNDESVRENQAMKDKVHEFYLQYLGLVKARVNAINDKNEDEVGYMSRLVLNREVRMLEQVIIPKYAMSLSQRDWIAFSAYMYEKNPQDRDWWLYSVNPSIILASLKKTFKRENTMLIGEHNLGEGDIISIPPLARSITHEGKELKLSNGIIAITSPVEAVVTKVYKKSVIIEIDA